MDLERLVPEYVRGFEPYVPSRPDEVLMQEYGAPFLHRLNNNENTLGPPPLARQVVAGFPVERVPIYPSGDAYDLRHALAARFGLDPGQVLVGNGSCEVIGWIVKAFCEPGDNIVTADKTFAVYEWVAQFSGIEPRLVPLREMAFDAEGMLERLDERTKVVFVCNPNNPTGSYWPATVVEDFLRRVGDQRIVVLDEAYCEYVEREDYASALSLLERFPNLVVFRTFSKMYALASLRVGYMVASPGVAHAVRRTCIAYSVNTLAQRAALAALADDAEHLRRSRAMVCEARGVLLPALDALGLPHAGGEGNYLMVRVPVNDTLMYRRLMRRGMMVRPMTGFRFPGWIRVTLREREVMEQFVEALAAEVGCR